MTEPLERTANDSSNGNKVEGIGPRNQLKLPYVVYDVSSICGDFSCK